MQYGADIDGLRAAAVFPVVFYHADLCGRRVTLTLGSLLALGTALVGVPRAVREAVAVAGLVAIAIVDHSLGSLRHGVPSSFWVCCLARFSFGTDRS